MIAPSLARIRNSLGFVALVIVPILAASFWGQWQAIQKLPSYYDDGVALEKVFRTSPTPVLIEFYTDACSSCQRLTPLLHTTVADRLGGKVRLVMIDAANPKEAPVVSLFGVRQVPELFLFDGKRMKKQHVPLDAVTDGVGLVNALHQGLDQLRLKAAKKAAFIGAPAI